MGKAPWLGSPKYKARKYRHDDGQVFDSMAEFRRWETLQFAIAEGVIRNLERQVPYELKVNGILICTYYADFVYQVKILEGSKLEQWINVVEDFKGFKTADYRIKKKLMKAVWDIDIEETK